MLPDHTAASPARCKKPDFLETEARQWIIDLAGEITRALWGFGVDGMCLLELLDSGHLDSIIHYTPHRNERRPNICLSKRTGDKKCRIACIPAPAVSTPAEKKSAPFTSR